MMIQNLWVKFSNTVFIAITWMQKTVCNLIRWEKSVTFWVSGFYKTYTATTDKLSPSTWLAPLVPNNFFQSIILIFKFLICLIKSLIVSLVALKRVWNQIQQFRKHSIYDDLLKLLTQLTRHLIWLLCSNNDKMDKMKKLIGAIVDPY